MPLVLAVVLLTASAAQALTPEEEALLSGRQAPVVTVTKKSPSPTPTPAVPTMMVPLAPPAPRLNPFPFLPNPPAGEVSLQQGGLHNGTSSSALSTGTSRLGLALRGVQGEVLWNLRGTAERQNELWQLGDSGLVAYHGALSHLTLGDELELLGGLLMDDMPVRGAHVHHGGDAWAGKVFVGTDRPILNNYPTDRTVGGAQLELGQFGFGVPRLRLIAQDDRRHGLTGGALSLGTKGQLGPAAVEADLAGSGGNMPGDTGYRLAAQLPWSIFTLKGSHMRQGPYFQVVRSLGMPREGLRTLSEVALTAEPMPSLTANATLGLRDINLDGHLPIPRQNSRTMGAGLSFAPEGGLTTSVDLSRNEFVSTLADQAFGTTLDRLATEVKGGLPGLPQARARWDALLNTPTGSTSQLSHFLTLDAGPIAGSAFSAIETVSFTGNANLLNHALSWDGTLFGQRARLGSRAYVEHRIETPWALDNRYGLNLSLGAAVTGNDTIEVVGYLDRTFDGRSSSANWLARYVTHFGGVAPGAVQASGAVLAGRVVVAPGLAARPDAVQVLLDRVQMVPVGPDGRFRFDNVPPGPHALTVDTSRLPPGATLAPSQRQLSVVLERGQTREDLAFTVGPAHRVTGRVIDEAGAPVEGVGVLMTGTDRYETWTDARGDYAFEDVAGGTYSAQLAPPEPEGSYTWEPAAVAVGLAGGQPVEGVDFRVYERKQRVTLEEGDPFAEAQPPAKAGPEGVLSTARLEAVALPRPAVAGRKVTLKVLVRGPVRTLRARLGTGSWRTLKPAGQRVWQLDWTLPKGHRSPEARFEIELVGPKKTERFPLPFSVRQP